MGSCVDYGTMNVAREIGVSSETQLTTLHRNIIPSRDLSGRSIIDSTSCYTEIEGKDSRSSSTEEKILGRWCGPCSCWKHGIP